MPQGSDDDELLQTRVQEPEPARTPSVGHPADTAVQAEPPDLTPEQYAWICDKVEKAPGNEEQVLAWLGLSVAVKAKLDAQWHARLQNDPDVHARFVKARGRSD